MIDVKYLNQAVKWLNGSRDFEEGLQILIDARFRPGVIRKLSITKQRPGAMERLLVNMKALVDAFCVKDSSEILADTDAELHVFEGKEDVPTSAPEAETGILSHENEEGNIGVIVKRYASLYRMRDQAFKQLKDVGEKNDEASCILRKQLSEQIENCTDQMEKLYPFYEKYDKSGEQPSDEATAEAVKEPSAEATPSETPKDLSSMSKEELVKEQYNIAKRISRTRNKILYQSENKLDVENPLPEGSKRLKLEKRIEKLTKELEAVKIRIIELS